MRALIGKALGPLFETIVGRLDPSVEIGDHHAFVALLTS
jgi:hypothetical protein